MVEAHVAGGIAVEEVTRDACIGEWHPHLHLISDVDVSEAVGLQGKVTALWVSVTGDRDIVDVRSFQQTWLRPLQHMFAVIDSRK